MYNYYIRETGDIYNAKKGCMLIQCYKTMKKKLNFYTITLSVISIYMLFEAIMGIITYILKTRV